MCLKTASASVLFRPLDLRTKASPLNPTGDFRLKEPLAKISGVATEP